MWLELMLYIFYPKLIPKHGPVRHFLQGEGPTLGFHHSSSHSELIFATTVCSRRAWATVADLNNVLLVPQFEQR